MDRFVIISGCSGGGKSTLLAEFARRGFATVEEPGRRVVREELATGGTALPWLDPVAFARRITAMAQADYAAAQATSALTFFDRGLIDAAVALDHCSGGSTLPDLAPRYPYHRRVFMAPPWPELFTGDAERRHGLDAAVAEHDRLVSAYATLGHEVVFLPKWSLAERADFVLEALAAD